MTLIFHEWPEPLPIGVEMWGTLDKHCSYTIARIGGVYTASWSPLDREAICEVRNLLSFKDAVRVLEARANAH